MDRNLELQKMLNLEIGLRNLDSYYAGENILHGITLHPKQISDALKMIYSKRAILRYDTGTGKTLVAAAVMKLLLREDQSRCFLMFITKDQCLQTPDKLSNALGVPVIATNAEASAVSNTIFSDRYLRYPVVLLTYDCLNNLAVMKHLFSNKDKFCCVFLDEAHLINNVGNAQRADMIQGLCNNFEYCFALTATPIVSNLLQFAKLASLIDPKRYPNYKDLKKKFANGSICVEDDPLFFINRTAEEMGRHSEYRGKIIWVQPLAHQKQIIGGNALLQLCKGEGAVPQAETLAKLVKANSGKRGLIYINQHSVRNWVLPFLDKYGIRYDCINGNVVKERPQILKRFNEDNELDVLITSVTTAIDADCDYVIFYEFTVELKQMIGRADRGLDSKIVDVYFILTANSAEPSYFKENIVERSELVKKMLSVSNQELEMISDELDREVIMNC